MDFLTFRNNALQALTLFPEKERKRNKKHNKTEIETWIKSEYERHYKKESDQ